MNTSASAISPVFWLPEPAVEVGSEKPKTKPVQTDVETRLWKSCQRAANSPKQWIEGLIYTVFAGSSAMSVAAAFQNLNGLLTNDGLDHAVSRFFQ
jgi:hypothetical protein